MRSGKKIKKQLEGRQGVFVNQERLCSTCCAQEPNTNLPLSHSLECIAMVISCGIKFKARLISCYCAICLLDGKLEIAQ